MGSLILFLLASLHVKKGKNHLRVIEIARIKIRTGPYRKKLDRLRARD